MKNVKSDMKLPNQKEIKFLEHYLDSGNATEAARLLGYKQPEQSGYKILKRPHIERYLKKAEAEITKNLPTKEAIQSEIVEIARSKKESTRDRLSAYDMYLKIISGYAAEKREVTSTNKTNLTVEHIQQLTIEELEKLLEDE